MRFLNDEYDCRKSPLLWDVPSRQTAFILPVDLVAYERLRLLESVGMCAVMAVLKGLKLLIAQFSFSGVKILSVIMSCFSRALEHESAMIVVSADSEPGKWVSSRRFRDSFSFSLLWTDREEFS